MSELKYAGRALSCDQGSGVTLHVGTPSKKAPPPLLAPLPNIRLILKDKLAKSLKECVSRAKRTVLLVL